MPDTELIYGLIRHPMRSTVRDGCATQWRNAHPAHGTALQAIADEQARSRKRLNLGARYCCRCKHWHVVDLLVLAQRQTAPIEQLAGGEAENTQASQLSRT